MDCVINHTLDTGLPHLLGTTNPCPIAVHKEPFFTSVHKVHICVFATTTKICTRHHFTPVHTAGCFMMPTPSYSWQHRTCYHGQPSVTRFSAIHFQG
ncbi:hypothetical protein SLEP1_g59978 [Rubroshorea leprosula]|uniref:Uncharacterized protein n=1 Tax=Rubroshorea leprosula TaxID=152421 RepID=A0AAV5MTY2_9ROSI|nr:hypothetical protein SLEP1_g59978 [Rubroshorea leprosula]